VPNTKLPAAPAAPAAAPAAPDVDGLRVLNADLVQDRAREFQNLDLEDHLRLGNIERSYQLLHHPHGFRCVLHDQEIGLLVDEHILALDHALHQIQRLFHIGVGEIEAAHHQFAVFLLLRRGVGVDENGIIVEHLALELVGQQDQFDHIIERGIAHEDVDLGVRAHVAVEYEIDSRSTRDDLEHGLETGVAELQRDGFRERRFQSGRCLRPLGGHLGPQTMNNSHELARFPLAGVLRNGTLEFDFGLLQLPRLDVRTRLAHGELNLAQHSNDFQPSFRTCIAGIEFQSLPV
jgi:hypothetical protein